jgi:hypothetical protein
LVDPSVEILTDDLLLRVLARPGFSTAAAVSGVSGRGVGVDVAVTRARALGGTLSVSAAEGTGLTFALRVPLTLAIVRALLTGVGEERYAVPSSIPRASRRCGTGRRWCSGIARCPPSTCASWWGPRARHRSGGPASFSKWAIAGRR